MDRVLKHPRSVKIINTMIYVVGIGGNIAVLPQIIQAWSGPAPGLAVMTWVMFVGISLIWLVYAYVHGQKPLLVAQFANISCNLLVVLGWTWHQVL